MAQRLLSNVPFNEKPYKNVDETSNTVVSTDLINGILIKTDNGFISRFRAGFTNYVDLLTSTKVDGLYWWTSKNIIIAVSNGDVFSISGGVATNLGGVTVASAVPVTFAEFGDNLFMANGGQIFYTDGFSAVQFLADPDAPTLCTHIQFIEQYLVANDTNQDKFFRSEVGNPFSWSALDFATAESSFDIIEALHVYGRNIYIFGTKSIEYWYNDGVTPLRPRPEISIDDGTISPYSIASSDAGVFYLNNNKEVYLLSQGGARTEISLPYNNKFQELTTITDAIAWNETLDGKGFYVITFPTEKKTYCYDYINDYWSERASFSDGEYGIYNGNCYVHAEGLNKHLLGDTGNGKIYEMSYDVFQDDGAVIRYLNKTGHINYNDNSNNKMNVELVFRLKRGFSHTEEPRLMYRRNVDNRGFLGGKTISLGNIGKTDMIRKLFTQGIFRTVQHEITVTDPVDFQLISVQEEYEPLTGE